MGFYTNILNQLKIGLSKAIRKKSSWKWVNKEGNEWIGMKIFYLKLVLYFLLDTKSIRAGY